MKKIENTYSATIQQKQGLVWLFFTQQHFIEKTELDSLFTPFHAVYVQLISITVVKNSVQFDN